MTPIFSSRGIVLMLSVTLGVGLINCTSNEVTTPSPQTDNPETTELAADNQEKKKPPKIICRRKSQMESSMEIS